MQPDTPSRTALATALMRALHTRTDTLRLLDDPWGDRLVPDEVKAAMRARAMAESPSGATVDENATSAAISDAAAAAADRRLRASPAYANVILRSRLAEDALAVAVARGVSQYVLIGAGFDSYALRRPASARSLTVIEVDHPATQGLKRRRIADCGIEVPPKTYFVAADLATEGLSSALARSPFQHTVPAFFSWLGVSMYLTRDANMATLRAIRSLAAPGSELAFSYVDQARFDTGGTSSDRDMGRAVAAIGEPFLSGFHPHELPGLLCSAGLDLIEDITDVAAAARYDPAGRNDFQTHGSRRLAHVRVG